MASQPQGYVKFACIHRNLGCPNWVWQNGSACGACIVRNNMQTAVLEVVFGELMYRTGSRASVGSINDHGTTHERALTGAHVEIGGTDWNWLWLWHHRLEIESRQCGIGWHCPSLPAYVAILNVLKASSARMYESDRPWTLASFTRSAGAIECNSMRRTHIIHLAYSHVEWILPPVSSLCLSGPRKRYRRHSDAGPRHERNIQEGKQHKGEDCCPQYDPSSPLPAQAPLLLALRICSRRTRSAHARFHVDDRLRFTPATCGWPSLDCYDLIQITKSRRILIGGT